MTDVCLLAENTYPHALGGIGAWVDGLIRSLPDVSFSVASLREPEELGTPAHYAAPPNLREVAVLPVDPEAGQASGGVPDAAVYHALCAGPASDLAHAAARSRGAAFVLGEHGLAWREALHGVSGCRPMRRPDHGRRSDASAALRWSRRLAGDAARAYASADAVTAVSKEARGWQLALGAPPARAHVIANAVAPAACRSHGDRAMVIAHVGRVVAIKDVELFIRACRIVSQAFPEARFLVIGPLDAEPRYAERCQDLAAALGLGERIAFTGPMPLADWRRRVDVVALTSLSEGQPLALLEAMSAGIPVVATAVGGVPELLAGGGGTLVEPGDATAMAARILDHADPAVRRLVGRRGRRTVRLRHMPEAHARAYAGLYARLERRRA